MRFLRYFCCLTIMCVISFTGCGIKHNENLPHNPIRLQAKVDAESDARRDVNLLAYFGVGMSAPFAAWMCGLTGLRIFDLTIGGYEGAYFPYINASMGAGTVLSMLIGYYIRPPNPPPERLIGKSPEYVTFYADAYRAKMRWYRARLVAAGSALSCAILTVAEIYFYISEVED